MPQGESHTLVFEVTALGGAITWERTTPFLDVELRAHTHEGAPVEVWQPPLDLPVQTVVVSLEAGGTTHWHTPLSLRFGEPPEQEADGFTWWVRAPRDAVVLEATFSVAGEPMRCTVEDGSPSSPRISTRPLPTRRPAPPPDVVGARLAELLAGTPDLLAWHEILRILTAWHVPTMGPAPTADVEARLVDWPDEIRMAYGAIVFDPDDVLARVGPLVRTVVIETRSERGSTWLWKVAEAPQLARVTRLEVTRSEVGAGSLACLLQTTVLRDLRHLDLTLQWWNDSMRDAFAQGPLIPRLHHLGLRSGELDDAHVREMFARHDLSGLRVLDLRHNHLSPAGKAWMAERWGPGRPGLLLDPQR